MRKKRLEEWFQGQHASQLEPHQALRIEKLFLRGQEIMRERISKVEPNKLKTWEEWQQSPSLWGTTGSPGRVDNTEESSRMTQESKGLGRTKFSFRV